MATQRLMDDQDHVETIIRALVGYTKAVQDYEVGRMEADQSEVLASAQCNFALRCWGTATACSFLYQDASPSWLAWQTIARKWERTAAEWQTVSKDLQARTAHPTLPASGESSPTGAGAVTPALEPSPTGGTAPARAEDATTAKRTSKARPTT